MDAHARRAYTGASTPASAKRCARMNLIKK